MTTIDDIIALRARSGLGDLLIRVFDAGVSLGMGQPHDDGDESFAALIQTIRARWHCEIEAGQSWASDPTPREAPPWLRAHAERQVLTEPPPPQPDDDGDDERGLLGRRACHA